MSNRTLFTFMIDPSMRQALKAIKERDGIGQSEQARRALAAWIASKGIKVKGAAKKKRKALRSGRPP